MIGKAFALYALWQAWRMRKTWRPPIVWTWGSNVEVTESIIDGAGAKLVALSQRETDRFDWREWV